MEKEKLFLVYCTFLGPSIHIGLAFLDLYDVSRMLAVSVFQFT